VGIYCATVIYHVTFCQRATPPASKLIKIAFLPWHSEAICDLLFFLHEFMVFDETHV
jgi:hypothetical protein